MNKYIKLFNQHIDYEAYINSQDKRLPNVSYCENEDELHYNALNWAEEYFTTVALEDGTISFNIYSSIDTDCIVSIDYSVDNGNTWVTTLNEDDKEENLVINVNVNAGDKILWRGDAEALGKSSISASFFSSTCKFIVRGNIMSLLYGHETFNNKTTIYEPYTFAYLFCNPDGESQCKVVNAKNLILPALNFEEGCYYLMFNNCTFLINTPKLPAMTLVTECYRFMFSGCTSLTTAPELPAINLAEGCYQQMFKGCTALTTASELPATTLEDHCYDGMFYGCTSLVIAPELPATALVSNCYLQMFKGCTSLVTAPELPATTLASNCYANMFSGCSSLNYIKAMFTTTPNPLYTSYWVENVAANGTFVKNSNAEWNVTGSHGVPSGWTVQTASE